MNTLMSPRVWTNLALALVTAFLAGCSRTGDDAATALHLYGNVEVVDAQVSFRIPGRLLHRHVDEGQTVSAGQSIAELDDAEQQQAVALRHAELAAAEALLTELEAGSRPQEIAAAEAALRSAEAERERAQLDLTRQEELRQQDVVSRRDFESAQAVARVAAARAREAAERLELVKAGPRAETIAQARARVQQAQAALALAELHLSFTHLQAPFAGVVLAHHMEAGEQVAAGTPIVTLAQTGDVWVRAYLNETDLGRVRRGQRALVRTDSYPDKRYEGIVSFIASEAEFTPRTVQTPKERVRLVFRIKVDLPNPQEELKPGMPAEVIIPL